MGLNVLLQAKNIQKNYRQGGRTLHILKGIDLEINGGDFLCLVGPSGAGKSTLMHILGGLDEPSEGEVFIEGENIYRLRDHVRAKLRNIKLGFVFQFYHLLPEFTALENVALPALIQEDRAKINREMKEKAKSLLMDVGLGERLEHKPNQLSGGEQQRVAIARALINQPKLILCDEPTGNLDSASGQEIIDLLISLNKKHQQTLLIVTHDEKVASQAHRTMHMEDGFLTAKEKEEV